VRKAELAKSSAVTENLTHTESAREKTAYYISDVMPPGTWNSSVTAQLEPKNGVKAEMTTGLGFTNEEVTQQVSTAHHDIAVGLICFDCVYFSLTNLGKVHTLLGSEIFWQAIQTDALGFVHLKHDPAVISTNDSLMGGIGLMSVAADPGGKIVTPATIIRNQIHSVSGKESIVDKLLSELERKVETFADADTMEMASLVRASVMMPEVARLLGIGEAILPSQVPKWLTFPYLRMAHLVHVGLICDRLGIQAAQIPFGGARLASAAFGVQTSVESAHNYASYVLSGRFDADIGAALARNPSIFQSILRFRTSSEGEAFRREIHDQLLANAATEFVASINAGLKKNIPLGILQKANDKLSTLLTENIKFAAAPAVWTNAIHSDDSTWLWRAKSRKLFLDMAKKRGVRGDDPCLCGSGDESRLCCLLALRD
jgi:hypothetical protein